MDNQQIGFSFSKKRRRDNRVGKVMKAIAVIIYIAGFIVGLVFHSSAGLMFAAWGAGFISGSFFLAIAEIIFLLDSFFDAEEEETEDEEDSIDDEIVEGEEAEKKPSATVCAFCGAPIAENVQFCASCGKPLSGTASESNPLVPNEQSTPSDNGLPGTPI